MAKQHKNYEAFTLVEILLVVGLLTLFSVGVIIAINPLKLFQQTRNVDRWNSVIALQSALTQWGVDGNSIHTITQGDGAPLTNCTNGTDNIVTGNTSMHGEVDISTHLVEGYLAQIPADPLAEGNDTGFDICMNFTSRNSIIVTAPLAENYQLIEANPVFDSGNTIAMNPEPDPETVEDETIVDGNPVPIEDGDTEVEGDRGSGGAEGSDPPSEQSGDSGTDVVSAPDTETPGLADEGDARSDERAEDGSIVVLEPSTAAGEFNWLYVLVPILVMVVLVLVVYRMFVS